MPDPAVGQLGVWRPGDPSLPACPNCRAPAGHLCVQPLGATLSDYSGHCLDRIRVMNTIDSTAVEIQRNQIEAS